MKKLVFVCSLVICLMLALTACSPTPTPTPGPETPAPAAPPQAEITEEIISVTAEELYKAYDENEVAADAKYEGRILRISGVIKHIAKNVEGYPFITFQTDALSTVYSVQCFFPLPAESELVNLSEGQYVIVQGRCDGRDLNILINDCSFIIIKPLETVPPATPEPETAAAVPDKPAAMPVSISAEDLYSYYLEGNVVLADTYFKDKLLKVEGVVTFIGVERDMPYICLDTGKFLSPGSLRGYFSSRHNDMLAQMTKGQLVVFEGTCEGILDGHVYLSNCKLVSVETPVMATPEATVAAPVEVTARNLYRYFMKDEVQASEKYLDKDVIVTGRIIDLGLSTGNRLFVSLSGEELAYIGTNCYFDSSISLATFEVGQQVTIKGKVSGYKLVVEMEDCVFVAE